MGAVLVVDQMRFSNGTKNEKGGIPCAIFLSSHFLFSPFAFISFVNAKNSVYPLRFDTVLIPV
jgi:hypothetical protein